MSVNLSAQDVIVFGQVLNATDGTPIAAANVWIKNTSIGTSTNAEGYFFLRLAEPQKRLCVSVVGYRRFETRLAGTDQVLNIALKEESHALSELLVTPGENEALPLLKRVRQKAIENDPDRQINLRTHETRATSLSLTQIRRKTVQRRLLRSIASGLISADDSTFLMPLFDREISCQIDIDREGEISKSDEKNDQKALQILPPEQISIFVENYSPNINFYRNTVSVVQTNFVSPLAAQGTVYYRYFLVDSLGVGSEKQYYLRFRPKNATDLAFRGEMWIDSTTLALQKIRATLSPEAAVNYINGMTIEQTFARNESGKFFYQQRDCAVSFNFNVFDKNAKTGASVIFAESIENRHTESLEKNAEFLDSIGIFRDSVPENFVPKIDSISPERQQIRNAIDSLNQSRLQRLAYNLIDLLMNGYVHAWKFDIGPAIDYFRYNRLEGFRPTLSLRTGEKLVKNFTVGGYFGYGFGDKSWKYGGEIQAFWGKERRHSIAFFYNKDVVRHSYRYADLLTENRYGRPENLLTTCSFLVTKPNLYEIHQLSTHYRYEQAGFRLTTQLQGTDFYSNPAMQFVQNGTNLARVRVASAQVAARVSFGERSLDNFFHRYYLETKLPVLNFVAEGGRFEAGETSGHFGVLHAAIRHSVPIVSGKLIYSVEGGCVLGNVPWILLETPRLSQTAWSKFNFSMLEPMTFMSDAYVSTHIRYISSGWIFGYIPYIKRLNIREDFVLRMTYGSRRSGHESILAMPESVQPMGNVPYIEIGFGFCNIFRVLSVKAMCRVTHRYDRELANWGVSIGYDLGL